MNVLAHALLAAPDPELMVGSLIGDFVRGRIDPAWPRSIRHGIALHRSIDVYTDAHEEVAAARALFAPPLRRYAGILLDIWFDHLLARRWREFSERTLDDFSVQVRNLLVTHRSSVPARMTSFVGYLEANNLPAAYRETAMIGTVLHGVSRRLSRDNPIGDALPALMELDAPLLRHFDAFFPALESFAAGERARLDLLT